MAAAFKLAFKISSSILSVIAMPAGVGIVRAMAC